jgi:regulator of sigma E protease
VDKVNKYSWLFLVAIILTLVLARWTLLVAILGLALLITVHEFGHFVFAKLFGMRVEKFYVGFPPAAWKRVRGETEYGLGVIPLGGFCKISGMTEDEMNALPEEVKPRAYYNQKVWKRNLTIFAGPLFNFLIAIVILFVFLTVQGQVQPTLKTSQVVATVQVNGKQVTTPAAKAGLRAGDTLIGADGQTWSTWAQASAFLQKHPNQTVQLTYRDTQGQVHTTTVTLGDNPASSGQGYLGVMAGERYVHPAPWTTASLAVTTTGTIFADTFKGFWWLISGKIGFGGKNGAVGPVGIVDLSQNAVRQNWYPLLLAFLSVNLGIVNLLPILPFDGGHIFFNAVEAARRGRRVDRRVLERVVAVGTALLVVLFIYLTFNDIKRIFGG